MSTEQLNVISAGSVAAVSADERHILAERFKTKQCRNYIATGACPYVHRCMFAHGEEDQRTYEENMRDGLFTEEAIRAWRRASRQQPPPPHYGYLPSYEELYCAPEYAEYPDYDYYYDECCEEYDEGAYPYQAYQEDFEVCSVGTVSSVSESPVTHYRWNPYSWSAPRVEMRGIVAAVDKSAQKQALFEP